MPRRIELDPVPPHSGRTPRSTPLASSTSTRPVRGGPLAARQRASLAGSGTCLWKLVVQHHEVEGALHFVHRSLEDLSRRCSGCGHPGLNGSTPVTCRRPASPSANTSAARPPSRRRGPECPAPTTGRPAGRTRRASCSVRSCRTGTSLLVVPEILPEPNSVDLPRSRIRAAEHPAARARPPGPRRGSSTWSSSSRPGRRGSSGCRGVAQS